MIASTQMVPLDDLCAAARQLLPRHDVSLAYLHGSQATGQATPLSDIDIAIVTESTLPARQRLRVELTLENEFAARCQGDYDVRIINEAPLEVRAQAVQHGRLLYVRDDRVRAAYEAEVRDRYFDFLPILHFHREAYFRASRAALKQRGLL